MFLVFLSKVFRVYSYEELATLRPRISTDRSQIAGLAELRGRVSVPIMVGESMWDNKECAVVIRAGAADVANVYVHESGGGRAATPHHSPVACVYAHSHSRLTRTHTGRCCKRAETSPSAKQLASLD